MKITVAFIIGFITAVSLYRIPHYPLFRDLPQTPAEWTPKVRGAWSDEDRRTLEGYYNGGVNK